MHGGEVTAESRIPSMQPCIAKMEQETWLHAQLICGLQYNWFVAKFRNLYCFDSLVLSFVSMFVY